MSELRQDLFPGSSENRFLGYEDKGRGEGDPKLANIIDAAAKLGIFSITDIEIDEDRSIRAAELATDLINSPSRVMSLEDLNSERGILSNQERGIEPISPSRRIQDASDKISFTFGIPYYFHRRLPYRQADLDSKPVLVVLDQAEMLERDDVEILFTDAGLVYRHFNPVNGNFEGLREGRPESEVSQLEQMYHEILSNPDSHRYFKEVMSNILKLYSLSKEQLLAYMTEYVTRSVPVYKGDTTIFDKWRGTHAPEGRVEKNIGFNAIKSIIVYEDQIERAKDIIVGSADDVDIVPACPAPGSKPDPSSRTDLLESYIDYSDIRGMEPLINFLKQTDSPGA